MDRALSHRLLASLPLRNVSPETEAGLVIASLPLPRGADAAWSFAGRPTFAKPIGQWWNQDAAAPRRLLLVGDAGDAAPAELKLDSKVTAPQAAPPTAEAVLFEQSSDPELHWERHLLRITWNGRRIGLLMGMRVGQELRWWEYCRLVTLSKSETCVEIEMAGSIPHVLFEKEHLRSSGGYSYPYLHKHHWLTGHIYARLHSNGVCEVYAHHINSRFVDDGLQLNDAVPVVGIQTDGVEQNTALGPWDGSAKKLDTGDVRFDLTDAAYMATPEQPGRFDREGGFLVWQPYLGMELFSGIQTQEQTGDPFIFKAEQRLIPRGMARTLRFSLSLNPKRAPGVARYVAPAWWYGVCEEFAPQSLLPVSDKFDKSLVAAQRFLRNQMVPSGFEEGSLPRGTVRKYLGRNEPGWEGEAAGAAFLLAYRTGEATDYGYAMRASYCFTDLYLDHAQKLSRPHGYPPNALSIVMSRVHASIYAYLETGDQYCLNIARSVVDNCFWTHKNSWPRLAVGRDACFVRGAMMLYRFFNDPRALEITRETIKDVCAAQEPGGYFGDQGGGSGIHGWGGYVVKPWMGFMAVGGLLDYLDLFPDGDPAALACVKKFADWLMSERRDLEGGKGISYQHFYNHKREFGFEHMGGRVKLPTRKLWHMDYMARLMTFCSLRFNDPSYHDAWVESFDGNQSVVEGDHSLAQSVQYIPWAQAMTWRARLDEQGDVVAEPVKLGEKAPERGTVMGPRGVVEIERKRAKPQAVTGVSRG